ncbi:MAG: S8 family serine peptidase [Lachnospiraceae bacterium]|nr:S8 family serine peptidase [Lachnospiraceae bacterium]
MIDKTKLSTELNLSLSVPYKERENSLGLNVGYYPLENEWELIIRYFGNLDDINEEIAFSYIELFNGFAIIRIKQENIEQLSNNPQIIFIEKPKEVYFESDFEIGDIDSVSYDFMMPSGYNTSCFNLINYGINNYSGEGVLIAVIDSGINYFHPEFLNNNKTGIYEIWDQNISGNPPYNLKIGSIYNEDDINNLILNNDKNVALDLSGHGTAVTSIIKRLVPESKLLIIKLRENYQGNFSRITSIMLGITYAIKKSMELMLPLVINLSFGNNYGDHDSGAILERYIDSVADISKSVIVTGTGNEGTTSRHTEFSIMEKSWYQEEFYVSRFEKGINIQIWRKFTDVIDIFLVTPTGIELGPFNNYQETMRYSLNNMSIFIINGLPSPLNINQETYISISPQNDFLQEGVWKLKFNPKSIVDGRVNIWLPVAASTSSELKFVRPKEFTTLTIPATAQKAISVGAYNQNSLTYAAFSGRGYSISGNVKPDIAAPGVDINVASLDGGITQVSGTSFAVPFVSSAAAILMEYGITDGNDLFLYGEKLKSYLIKGAKKLPGNNPVPNERIGWGVLCVASSFPN